MVLGYTGLTMPRPFASSEFPPLHVLLPGRMVVRVLFCHDHSRCLGGAADHAQGSAQGMDPYTRDLVFAVQCRAGAVYRLAVRGRLPSIRAFIDQ